ALWQKGVHIQAFSAQLQEGQEIFHLAVDKAAVAKQTFIENGWKATEETALAQTSRIGRQVKEAIGRRATRCVWLLYPSLIQLPRASLRCNSPCTVMMMGSVFYWNPTCCFMRAPRKSMLTLLRPASGMRITTLDLN